MQKISPAKKTLKCNHYLAKFTVTNKMTVKTSEWNLKYLISPQPITMPKKPYIKCSYADEHIIKNLGWIKRK